MIAHPSPRVKESSFPVIHKAIERQVGFFQWEAPGEDGYPMVVLDYKKTDWISEDLRLSCRPTPEFFVDVPVVRVCGDAIGSMRL